MVQGVHPVRPRLHAGALTYYHVCSARL